MLRFLRRAVESAYVGATAGTHGQRVNNAVLHMALRSRGYGNVGCLEETGESSFIALLGERAELCIDVGANRGEYTEALLRDTPAAVIAFEPHPLTYRELVTLGERYPERLVAVNQGVADTDGELELLWGNNSQLASFSEEALQIGYVGACNVNRSRVPVTTIDSFFRSVGSRFADRELTLLKVDTEGFEYEVLKGAEQTLRHLRPRFVQIEFNHHQLFRGHTFYSIARLLADYAAYQILPRARGLARVTPEDPLVNIFGYANFVFMRSDVRL